MPDCVSPFAFAIWSSSVLSPLWSAAFALDVSEPSCASAVRAAASLRAASEESCADLHLQRLDVAAWQRGGAVGDLRERQRGLQAAHGLAGRIHRRHEAEQRDLGAAPLHPDVDRVAVELALGGDDALGDTARLPRRVARISAPGAPARQQEAGAPDEHRGRREPAATTAEFRMLLGHCLVELGREIGEQHVDRALGNLGCAVEQRAQTLDCIDEMLVDDVLDGGRCHAPAFGGQEIGRRGTQKDEGVAEIDAAQRRLFGLEGLGCDLVDGGEDAAHAAVVLGGPGADRPMAHEGARAAADEEDLVDPQPLSLGECEFRHRAPGEQAPDPQHERV